MGPSLPIHLLPSRVSWLLKLCLIRLFELSITADLSFNIINETKHQVRANNTYKGMLTLLLLNGLKLSSRHRKKVNKGKEGIGVQNLDEKTPKICQQN